VLQCVENSVLCNVGLGFQCVAVCVSMFVAVCCSVLENRVRVIETLCCSVLQCELQCVLPSVGNSSSCHGGHLLQCAAVCCCVLQCVAVCGSVW